MGMLGDLLGTLGLISPSRLPPKTTNIYNDHEQHSAHALRVGLMRLNDDERAKVETALKEDHLWGNVVSSQRVLESVQPRYGYALAKKVQDVVLSKAARVGLSPEQKAKNLNYAKYQVLKARDNDKLNQASGFYGQNQRQEYASIAKRPGLSREEAKEYDPSRGFATKRPTQLN